MKSLSFQVAFVLVLLFQLGQSVTDIKAIQELFKATNTTQLLADIAGEKDCKLSKAAGCDALCMLYIPYYVYGPFRSGCLDGNDVCWCCDPSFDSGGNLVICPSDDDTNCNYGCYQYGVSDVSQCSHTGYGGGGYGSYGGGGGGYSGGHGGGGYNSGGGYSSGGGGYGG